MSKTAAGLVAYCKAQLGRPYWWGTFGQLATRELYDAKKAQYPGYYTADNFLQQLGQRVHDCVGLIKGYLWSETPNSNPIYNGAQDVSVDGLYRVCDHHGNLSTMPDVPGTCVFMAGMGHVGVYIGGGEVIEAKGHAWGVVKTRLSGRGWAFWGQPRWIDYSAQSKPAAEPKPESAPAQPSAPASGAQMGTAAKPQYYMYSVQLPLLKIGAAGSWVKSLQQLLIAKGYSCGEDGDDGEFGMLTYRAVKAAQRALKIDVDGEVGGETWAKLLGGD